MSHNFICYGILSKIPNDNITIMNETLCIVNVKINNKDYMSVYIQCISYTFS